MSQGMNDLLTSLSVSLSAEEVAFNGLCGVICGEIVAQRVKRNMSQKQFAEFMGVSQGMVSKWERGIVISRCSPSCISRQSWIYPSGPRSERPAPRVPLPVKLPTSPASGIRFRLIRRILNLST